ncbi:hypothetical protein VKT23_009733 [Stygiomarasmius scandens]|uniref:Cytochrome P450 n=1 Tax=Marasmiellus scandens TaxID=2682957 RepID=A0ABR1JFU8_9AGAR
MSHGYQVERTGIDPLVTLIEKAAQEFYLATQPGVWIVDTFPFLKYLPDWTFIPFKKLGKAFSETNELQLNVPHRYVQDQVLNKTARPSFTLQLLETCETEEERELIKYVSNTLYGGGLDTVVATISTFILAMVLFPDVQKKAQDELDVVVGTSRLPTFSDRDSLPYLNAIQREVMRWHPIGPIGIPHTVKSEDHYNGYLIPKGATVIANIWYY